MGTGRTRYLVLGPLVVVGADGAPIALRGDRQRRLVAGLVLHADRPVATDVLAELVWGDDLPEHEVAALQTHVSRLRRLLGDDAIVSRDGGYVLQPAPGQLDSDDFDSFVGDAMQVRQQDPERSLELLDAALALWRGDAFTGFEDWERARTEAARLGELRLLATEERFDALLALGRADQAAAGLAPIATPEQLRERMQALHMTALYRAGRPTEALRAYREHRRWLAEELGLEPSPALQALERSILDHTVDPLPSAPPIRPASARSALPIPGDRLIGRRADVASVTSLLERARLVTVTGPGGIGKTRLALEVAAAAAAATDDLVVSFCDLSQLPPGADITPTLATTLGVEERLGTPLADAIVGALADQHVLLVIDNCEHVLASTAAVIERVLAGTRAVRGLATSREVLAVGGEHLHRLQPLADEDAVELFRERAAAVTPSLPDDDDAVLSVCRRLDGLPLGIELAAARTNALSVGEIADGLHERFDLLSGGRRTVERQRSMEEAVRWSFDLLDGADRRACARLAVFAGGTTVDGVAAVTATHPAEAATIAARLVDRSLLGATRDPDGRTRFRMLDTVRHYGLDVLARSGELEGVQRCAAGHVVDVATSGDADLDDPARADRALFVLDAELPNMRAAHGWLLARGDLDAVSDLDESLSMFGHHRLRLEPLTWCERTLERLPAQDRRRARVQTTAALGRWQRGDPDGSWASIREGRALAVAGTRAVCRIEGAAANLEGRAGNLAEATRLIELAAALAIEVGDTMSLAISRFQRVLYGGLLGEEGIGARAEQWAAEAERTGNSISSAWARYGAGEVWAPIDPQRARRHLEVAVAHAERAGCSFVGNVAALTAATVEARHGDPRAAAGQLRELIERYRLGGLGPVEVTMLRAVAELLTVLGDHDTAAALHGAIIATDVSPAFGPDAERAASMVVRLGRRLGPARLAAQIDHGGQLADAEVLGLAAAALERWD